MEVPNDGVLLQQETQKVSGSHHNLTESSPNKSFSVCEFFRVFDVRKGLLKNENSPKSSTSNERELFNNINCYQSALTAQWVVP